MTDGRLRTVSVFVLAGCFAVLALTATASVWQSSDTGGATGYRVGDLVDVPREWLASEGDTVLVFLRSDCPASRELARELAGSGLGTRALAVVPDTRPDREETFAEAAGFESSAVRFADFRTIKIQVVPSVVIVAEDGRVKVEGAGVPAATSALSFLSEPPGA